MVPSDYLIKPPILGRDTENFIDWKFEVEGYLNCLDLWDSIENEYMPKYDKFDNLTIESQLEMKNNENAMNVLLDLVDKPIARHLNKLSSAYDMWNLLLDINKEDLRVNQTTCLNSSLSVVSCSSEETNTSSDEEDDKSDFTCMDMRSDEENETINVACMATTRSDEETMMEEDEEIVSRNAQSSPSTSAKCLSEVSLNYLVCVNDDQNPNCNCNGKNETEGICVINDNQKDQIMPNELNDIKGLLMELKNELLMKDTKIVSLQNVVEAFESKVKLLEAKIENFEKGLEKPIFENECKCHASFSKTNDFEKNDLNQKSCLMTDLANEECSSFSKPKNPSHSKRNGKLPKNHKRDKIENIKKNRSRAYLYQKLSRNRYGYDMHRNNDNQVAFRPKFSNNVYFYNTNRLGL